MFLMFDASEDPDGARQLVETEIIKKVKKLSPFSTYISLMKGFIGTGILYLPKNYRNGGWLWSMGCMVLSFLMTLYCAFRLLETKMKVPHGSFSDIGY